METEDHPAKTATPFHIVLVEPEIPPNTGNIARLCAATGTTLHLVGKLGFSLDNRQLKRAGLDYWPAVDIRQWETLSDLQQTYPNGRYWYTSKKAQKSYIDADFKPGDFLVFGKETMGLPETLLIEQKAWTIRIPIEEGIVRSLNLSNSAGIILYEARRKVSVAGQSASGR